MNPKHTLGGAVALLLLGIGAFLLHRSAPVSSAPQAPTGVTEATRSAPAPVTAPAPPPSPTTAISATFGRPMSGQLLTVDSFGAGSRLRADLDRLDPAAQTRALAKLSQMTCGPQDADSLQVDRAGGVFYACKMQVPPAPRAATQATTAGTGAPPPSAVPASQPPIRHSRPGAAKKIYLDFNGHQITGTAWNLAWGTRPAVANYDCGAYDIDGSPGSFNDQEQADILEVWERVSEDFAPFDIDVTTEEPAAFTSQTARALVTSKTDRNGVAMPSSDIGAGVAYLDVFGETNYGYHSPALIYFDKLYSWAVYMAEAVSHEVGHNLALSHDGISGGNEYYAGHGSGETSWAPIMGASYYSDVTQWSKGDYTGANNPEDDLALISARTGYAADDFGNNRASATPMSVSGATLSANGCLGTTGDADVFSFTTSGGSCSFSAVPYRAPTGTKGGNTDLKVLLLDSAGTTLATADSPDTTAADIATSNLAGGTYYLKISAVGAGSPMGSPPTGYTAYASLGRYHITGQLTQLLKPVINLPRTGNGVFGWPLEFYVSASNPVVTYGATGLPTGIFIDPSTGRISGAPLQAGTFNITLSATNAAGTGTAAFQLFVDTAPPAITTTPARRTMLAPGQSTTLSVGVASVSGNPTYQWYRQGQAIHGATSSTLSIGPAALGTASWYHVTITDGYGTRVSPPAFIQVAPLATTALAYGSSPNGLENVPADVLNPVAFSVGQGHALALLRDGTVRAWGYNQRGETIVPVGLGEVVAIAAGSGRSLALRADGTIVAWGGEEAFRTLPTNAQPAVGIAICDKAALALKPDGSIVYWNAPAHTQPVDFTDLSAITASGSHALGLRHNGQIVAWGGGESPGNERIVPSGLPSIVGVTAAWDASFALDTDRKLRVWTDSPFDARLAIPADLGAVAEIAAGSHVVALQTNGLIRAWGNNNGGPIPTPFPATEFFWAVAAGDRLTLLARDDTATQAPTVCTEPADASCRIGGTATFHAVFAGKPTPVLQWVGRPVNAPGFENLSDGPDVQGSTTDTLILSNSRSFMQVYCLARNGAGPTAYTKTVWLQIDRSPVVELDRPARQVGEIGQSLELTAVATGEGTMQYQWAHGGIDIPGAYAATLRIDSLLPEDAGWYRVTVSNGQGFTTSKEYHVLCYSPGATVTTWGNPLPPPPQNLDLPVRVAIGTTHAAAVQADGSVVSWGPPSSGGATAVPTGLTNVVDVVIGWLYSAALKADGTIATWGNISNWALPPSTAVGDIIQLAAQDSYLLAVRRNGQVLGWRYASWITPAATIPDDLGNVVAVAAGRDHALALLANGRIRAWGTNIYGQASVPYDLNGIVAIAAGAIHSLALRSNGTVVAWGSNQYGQAPASNTLTDVIAITASGFHSLALLRDGTVVHWGEGQSDPGIPTGPVATGISAGYQNSIAIQQVDTAPIVLASPTDKIVAESASVQFTVQASAHPAPSHQWQSQPKGSSTWGTITESAPFHGVQSATLTVAPTELTLSGDRYRCVVSNGIGPDAISDSALLTVRATFPGFRVRCFTTAELADPAISGPSADPDGDGLCNLLEYAFARDPRQAESSPTVTLTNADTSLVFTFEQPRDISDLGIILLCSSDLQTWSFGPAADARVTPLSDTVNQIELIIPAPPDPRQFYRLQITLP